MTDVFSIQVLTEKLTNLNNSQQSIETLSRWCIIHRKKAKQVVETWEKFFSSFPKEKRVPLMYLANDILQNSRRKGSEFVNEFWKVLPRALKSIYESDDDREKNVVMRLVNIWEERKVFGSRGRILKDEMLGQESKDSLPPVEVNLKSSQSIKITKKDAHSIRIKLAVGCMPERIVSAFGLVHDEQSNEENVLNKCKAAVDHLGKLEKDIDGARSQGNQHSSFSVSEFLEQETVLNQCIQQLENLEATRASLVSYLKEALLEQESKRGDIRLQLQVAKAEADHMSSLRQKLASAPVGSSPAISAIIERKAMSDSNRTNHVGNMVMKPAMLSTTFANSSTKVSADPNPPNHVENSMLLSTQSTSFTNSTSSAEDQNKKTAAAVAAKLAAMTSSAQVLTSVLSSLVAEEAASMNGSLKLGSFATSLPIFPPQKRSKLERPMQVSNPSNVHVAHMPQQSSPMPLGSSQAPAPSLAPAPPVNPPQPLFPPLPPSPLPQITPYNTQSSGGITGAVPYGFGGTSVSPPPPPPTHVLLGLMRSAPQSLAPPMQQPPPLQQPQPLLQQPLQQMPLQAQQLLPLPQTQRSTPGFFPPSGMGFYGQPPTASTGPPQAHQR